MRLCHWQFSPRLCFYFLRFANAYEYRFAAFDYDIWRTARMRDSAAVFMQNAVTQIALPVALGYLGRWIKTEFERVLALLKFRLANVALAARL